VAAAVEVAVMTVVVVEVAVVVVAASYSFCLSRPTTFRSLARSFVYYIVCIYVYALLGIHMCMPSMAYARAYTRRVSRGNYPKHPRIWEERTDNPFVPFLALYYFFFLYNSLSFSIAYFLVRFLREKSWSPVSTRASA
jgi:hypothetical protein